MKIILQQAQGEIIEKKSRFIATLCPVQSQEEAEQFIAACKKKYWDARHHCFAYIIGDRGQTARCSDDGEPSQTAGKPMMDVLAGAELHDVIGENNEIMHSSDDGEPSGTAGRPMLSVLTGQDVHNVAVVVTRYFGGVLLGTGGLVRAYQGAVSEAFLHAEIRQQLLMQELMLTAEYTDVGKIQYLLSQAGFRTADTEYGAKVLFHVLVPAGEENAAIKMLTEKTNGKTEITKGELRNETCE